MTSENLRPRSLVTVLSPLNPSRVVPTKLVL